MLSAWIGGAARVTRGLPTVGRVETERPFGLPPPPPLPPLAPPPGPGDGGPVVRLPIVEAAQRDLAARNVMDADDFGRLEQDARRSAFTVARVSSLEAIERIQAALVHDIHEGGTLREFRARVEQALGESMLSPAHIETVYRTNVGAAYTQGLTEILEHPLVGDEFPYLEYHAVHDSRARKEHREMESLGMNGTNVYRRDDPVMRKFLPPWDWNCRCAVVPIGIEDAAAKGVKEAQEWLATGFPPVMPDWVPAPPFEPSPSFAGPAGWTEGLLQ